VQKIIIEKGENLRRHFAFIDYENASDKVKRYILLNILQEKNKRISTYYKNMQKDLNNHKMK
jgi:ribosomal protein S15P/S13E